MVRGIPVDSLTCPTWYSGIGQTGGIWWDQVVRGIPVDSLTCPTWDRMDRWDMVGSGGTWDYHGQSHLSYMVQWDRADRWDGGPRWYVGLPRTVPPVLHGTVG